MSDRYLDDQGNLKFIEGTEDGKSSRVFKPIAFLGPITVYEEQVAVPVRAPALDAWEC